MPTPPFAYFGGKTNLAQRIVALLPDHDHYVEPYAGSLAVLLAKPRVSIETINDLDGDLVTFWRVLRDRPEDLRRAMDLTPHARAENATVLERLASCDDDLERARLVWVKLSQGRGGTMRTTGWRYYRNPAGTGTSMSGYLAGYAMRVPACAERLRGVSLECRDALALIGDYGQDARTLLYCDPPYLGSTRSRNYRHEMASEDEHRDLAGVLHACASAVVLSGYHSDLYDDLYDGWHRVELTAWTGNGIRDGRSKAEGARVEVLWSNRPLASQEVML